MLSKNKNIWGGIYVATICPMDENGGINEDELSNHFIDVMGNEGIVELLINGHAGENHLLNRDEKRRRGGTSCGFDFYVFLLTLRGER